VDASGQDSKGFADLSAAAKRNLRTSGALEVLTVLALIGGVLMVASEFFDLFHVENLRGGQIPEAARTAGENHGYALLIIGLAMIVATFLTRSSGQWLPAFGAALLGAFALAILLFGDLPDANRSELVSKGKFGTASPAAGFWLALVGTLIATLASAGLAYVMRSGAKTPN